MRRMNLKCFLLVLVLGLPLRMVVAADDLPKSFSFARYQAMMDRSPFAVATAVAPPATAPNFAKDLYVANAARSKEGDLVTIASSTDKNFKKYLTTNAPVEGFSISTIEWSERIGATKVTIAKDGQFATLSFNEALLRQPVPPGQNPVPPQAIQSQEKNPAGQPPTSTTLAVPAPNVKPMPVPTLPTPAPRVRGVIPRNPAGTPVAPQSGS